MALLLMECNQTNITKKEIKVAQRGTPIKKYF